MKINDLVRIRYGFVIEEPTEVGELEVSGKISEKELIRLIVSGIMNNVKPNTENKAETVTSNGEGMQSTETAMGDLPEFEFSQNEPTQMKTTLELFDEVTAECAEILRAKYDEYGASFAIMRLPSMTDQLLIKARRIRSIQEKTITATGESALADWKGLVNYGLLWLVQADLMNENLPHEIRENYFTVAVGVMRNRCADLLKLKTADYGDAWRDMRIESITDQILMKIERMRNIETQTPETAGEACVEIVKDIVNYAVFGVVKFKKME